MLPQHIPPLSRARKGVGCIPLRRMPAFCSVSRMVSRVSRKPGFSSACESLSASSPAHSRSHASRCQTYSLQLGLCLPAVVGIGCKGGLNATPQAGSVHVDASTQRVAVRACRAMIDPLAGNGEGRCRGWIWYCIVWYGCWMSWWLLFARYQGLCNNNAGGLVGTQKVGWNFQSVQHRASLGTKEATGFCQERTTGPG